MKRNILLVMALLLGGMASAQVESDTTRFTIGNTEFIIIGKDTVQLDEDGDPEKRESGDLTYWSGFEVGINLPMNGDFKNEFTSAHLQTDPAQSFVYSFNFMEKRIPIIKSYFGIVTGLGFSNSRYGFKNNQTRLFANGDTTLGVLDTTMINGFSKNQLRLSTFNVPLLFQINTSKYEDKNFHIAFGAIGGVRIGSNVKYKYESSDGSFKSKEKGRYNLSAFQLTGTIRAGYKDFGLFANYNILSLYEEDKSEVAYPLSFGVSFHF